MTDNLKIVMDRLKKSTPPLQVKEKSKTKVKEEEIIDDDLEEEQPVVEEKPVEEKAEEKTEEKEDAKPTEEQIIQQKAEEVALLQNDGVFRAEVLYQFTQLNQHLLFLNSLLHKATGGEDGEEKE